MRQLEKIEDLRKQKAKLKKEIEELHAKLNYTRKKLKNEPFLPGITKAGQSDHLWPD
jgi:phage shock protein A